MYGLNLQWINNIDIINIIYNYFWTIIARSKFQDSNKKADQKYLIIRRLEKDLLLKGQLKLKSAHSHFISSPQLNSYFKPFPAVLWW